MTKLELIEGRLHDNSIKLYEFAIDDSIRAMSHVVQGRKSIALNRAVLHDKADETSVLAEELGHFETGAFYEITPTFNAPAIRSTRRKLEGMAKSWAYKEYCPPDEIEAAFEQEGDYGDYAVAEWCGVSVTFLHRAIEFHRSCGVVFSFDDCDCA